MVQLIMPLGLNDFQNRCWIIYYKRWAESELLWEQVEQQAEIWLGIFKVTQTIILCEYR